MHCVRLARKLHSFSHATSREKGGLLSAGLKDSPNQERKAKQRANREFLTRERLKKLSLEYRLQGGGVPFRPAELTNQRQTFSDGCQAVETKYLSTSTLLL